MYDIMIVIARMHVWLCTRCGDRGGEGWVDGWMDLVVEGDAGFTGSLVRYWEMNVMCAVCLFVC